MRARNKRMRIPVIAASSTGERAILLKDSGSSRSLSPRANLLPCSAAPRALSMRFLPGSSDPVADPAPANVGDEWQRPIGIVRVVRVIDEERTASHIITGDEPPI